MSINQWWSPKCRSSYARWYKHTSCLSGTEKCFYAMTQLDVLVPVITGLMCQTTLELLHSQPVLNMHQAEEGMYCVDAASVSSLFPMSGPFSDAQWQTPRFISQAGFQPCGVQWRNTLVMLLRNTMLSMSWTRNNEETCHTWPLNWALLAFGLYSPIIYLILLLLSAV